MTAILLFLTLLTAQVATDSEWIIDLTRPVPRFAQAATDVQSMIDTAIVLDQYGYATKSAVIAFPKGDFYLDEPITYRGQPHTQLILRGAGRSATTLHYRGDGPYAIRFEGANGCAIESMRIINEATKPLKQIVWWDAVNADPSPPIYSGGSSGCRMSDVWIGSTKTGLAKDGCLIRIAHDAPNSSQVSSMVFYRLLLDGPGHGKGVWFDEDGNVKCFAFDTIGMTQLDYGIDWKASGSMVINDMSASDCYTAVVRQVGAGNLVGTGWNCEGDGAMLWQAGGNSPMFATITGFEWTGSPASGLAVRSHGATKLEAGYFQSWGKTPWIEVAHPQVASTVPGCLLFERVLFADGDDGRLPIRDPSGNKLLDPAGYYKDKPVSFAAENCFIGTKKVARIP